MTDTQLLLIAATVYIAPHLTKGMGLALGLVLLLLVCFIRLSK